MDALVITGPTASGKSELSFKLAELLNGEIISADSAQVYRGLDIGTAKPGRIIQDKLKHHLLDIRDPSEIYTVADFRNDTLRIISEIKGRGKVPIISGGTMLYLKALREGLADLPAANPSVRESIELDAKKRGWAKLHSELRTIDPISADRIKPNDSHRLQRALEVYQLTGTALSEHLLKANAACPPKLFEIAIFPGDREQLHKNIEQRFKKMLDKGFVEEVLRLKKRDDLTADLPALKSVGYRQIWHYLNNRFDRETMVGRVLAATRQLAKRQFTWLRGFKNIRFVENPDANLILKMLPEEKI
tara:strand:- start:217 stop:1128 length:912 start_codon:yes stop_codon:yes gene_type:complete